MRLNLSSRERKGKRSDFKFMPGSDWVKRELNIVQYCRIRELGHRALNDNMISESPCKKSVKSDDLHKRTQGTTGSLLLVSSIMEDRVGKDPLECVDRFKCQLVLLVRSVYAT